MLDVIDALLQLADPGGAINPDTDQRIATSGTTLDHTGARPFSIDLASDHWYAWVVEDAHVVIEVGDPPSERENFSVALLYVREAAEQAAQQRSRALSQEMEDRAHDFLQRLAVNRSSTTWEEAEGRIDRTVITGFSVRGIGLRVNGWRYRPS